MIIQTDIDDKLRELIHICKKTHNYKKIAVVGLTLLSNRVNEIGIKLGLRARRKENGETIHTYLSKIVSFLTDNFQITLVDGKYLGKLHKCELLFLKKEGNLSMSYISDVFELYYELQKIEIPDMGKHLSEDTISSSLTDLHFYSSVISPSNKNGNEDVMNKMMLHKIKKEEKILSSRLEQQYDPETFEQAIILKRVRASLERNRSGRITVRGTLKENLMYKKSISDIIGYFLLGIFVLLCGVGIVILFEVITFSFLTAHLSPFILLFFGGAGLFFYIYWSKFMRGSE